MDKIFIKTKKKREVVDGIERRQLKKQFFTKPILIILFIAAVFIIGIAASQLIFKSRISDECRLSGSGSGAPATPYFAEVVESGVIVKKGGRPIEGFEPFMFMDTYSGLQNSDFNCVKAYKGFYIVKNGQIIFIPERTNKMSTADRSITAYGMNRLLQNISDRLGRPWPHSNIEVDAIMNIIGVFP